MIDRAISPRYRWKVKGRLAVVESATLHGVSPAAARLGLDRKTVRAWRDRAREAGAAGLVPRGASVASPPRSSSSSHTRGRSSDGAPAGSACG